MGKSKTIVTLTEKVKGHRKYFRGITLEKNAKDVWKALKNGCFDVMDLDIEKLRAERKRKGGR